MKIYNYLQENYNFEINKQYELTETIKNNICTKFDMLLFYILINYYKRNII